MAINTHQLLNHSSLDTISVSISSSHPSIDSINSSCIMQKHKHQLLLPQTEKYNNNNNNNNISAYQPDKQLLQQKQSKTKNSQSEYLPKRRTKMKKSFSINNIKQITSSIDNHPLNHNYNDTDTDTNPSTSSHGENNFEDYQDDSMELDDDYDSDDLSYTSCLSSQSNSNYSVVFEKDPTTMSPTSNEIPFSYHSFNNDCFLYTNTKSSLGISIPMNRSHPMSGSLQSPISSQSLLSMSPPPSVFCLPSTTTSCSPITTNSISQSLEMERSLRRSSSSDSLYMLLKNASTSSSTPFSSSSPSTQSSSSSPTSTSLSPFSKKQSIKSTSKKSIYSNLSTSLRLFRNKLSSYNKENLLKFIMDSPRLTDEKLPLQKPSCPEAKVQEEETEETEETPMEELTTFHHHQHHNHHHELGLEKSQCIKYKTRELRTNSRFLILYAFDMNARCNSMTLPNSPTQDELYKIIKRHPNIKKFHYKHNIHRISNMSREKLWNNVILPPRQDDSPELFIKSDPYIIYNDYNELDNGFDGHYSIVRKLGKYMPWALKPSIKPAGVLPNSKWIFNGQAPNSGITKTQFTVKGWCNPRWVDHTPTN